MICRRSNRSILEACGTSIMHPAGTRAIRIPDEKDPTKAARIVLQQYVELVEARTEIVRVVNRYHHDVCSLEDTVKGLMRLGMGKDTAMKAIPSRKMALGSPDDLPDMRIGWLLWQEDLREFLYFEEPMSKPNPAEFTAEWRDSGGGRRKRSRNLWVYQTRSEEKRFSITTEAGAKIQPYFTVPMPHDPNLYHFVVQGEQLASGLVRVWLTQVTFDLLREVVGELNPDNLADAVERAFQKDRPERKNPTPFGTLAAAVLVPEGIYKRLHEVFDGVSDEHNFKQLIDALRA
jgi:hypothetical protein